jgi:WD40 repeat protein
VMRRLSKLAFYFVSAFTAVLLVLIGLFGQRCATVPISSVAFRPDGQEMLVVKLDGQVERWGGWPERAEYLYATGHTGYIGDIAFSPDGKLIATASEDTSVRLWDMGTGMPVRDAGTSISFSWPLLRQYLPVSEANTISVRWEWANPM